MTKHDTFEVLRRQQSIESAGRLSGENRVLVLDALLAAHAQGSTAVALAQAIGATERQMSDWLRVCSFLARYEGSSVIAVASASAWTTSVHVAPITMRAIRF